MHLNVREEGKGSEKYSKLCDVIYEQFFWGQSQIAVWENLTLHYFIARIKLHILCIFKL